MSGRHAGLVALWLCFSYRIDRRDFTWTTPHRPATSGTSRWSRCPAS